MSIPGTWLFFPDSYYRSERLLRAHCTFPSVAQLPLPLFSLVVGRVARVGPKATVATAHGLVAPGKTAGRCARLRARRPEKKTLNTLLLHQQRRYCFASCLAYGRRPWKWNSLLVVWWGRKTHASRVEPCWTAKWYTTLAPLRFRSRPFANRNMLLRPSCSRPRFPLHTWVNRLWDYDTTLSVPWNDQAPAPWMVCWFHSWLGRAEGLPYLRRSSAWPVWPALCDRRSFAGSMAGLDVSRISWTACRRWSHMWAAKAVIPQPWIAWALCAFTSSQTAAVHVKHSFNKTSVAVFSTINCLGR